MVHDRRAITDRFEKGRAEQDRDVHALGEYALVLNAKGAPDIALAAVAADEIVGCDHFVAAAFYIDDFASYFVAVLLKPFQRRVVADLHGGKRGDMPVQHGIEVGL